MKLWRGDKTARAGQSLARGATTAFTVLGITAALFVIANVYAYYALPLVPPVGGQYVFSFLPASAPASLDLYRRAFNLKPGEDPLGRFKATPRFGSHPTLPFITAPTQNHYYHIGREGLRYEPDWDDESVTSLLSGPHPLIFAMGGSTTLGHGVADDETWPYFFNRLRPDSGSGVMLNFGAHAYDQRTEISKLIYLLTNGYRPRAVIFLDGWNDTFMPRSNMRHVDSIIYHGFATGHGEIVLTPNSANKAIRNQFLKLLPFIQYLKKRKLPNSRTIKIERDAFVDGFDFVEAEYAFAHWPELAELHREEYKKLILESYRSNLKLIKTLADGYGFKAYVFFQPIGLLDPANLFVLPQTRTEPGYRYVQEIVDTVRTAIARGDIDMIDISQVFNDLDEPRYIDAEHYTPAANSVLARVIARYVTGAASLTGMPTPP